MTKKIDLKKKIIITDKKYGFPYSKGLLATSITVTGLSPKKAYHVAELVENHLRRNEKFTVSSEELKSITADILTMESSTEVTDKYIKWQSLGKLDKPLILLVGGTTGVGKSTIATEVAHRLGITRIVSTDAIREVMRAVFSKDLTPPLYESSFTAYKALRTPLPQKVDPVIIGFMEQIATVSVGIRAVIERAINENLDMVLEGIHLVPGFLDFNIFENAFVIPIIISVEDEHLHRSHFYVRGIETRHLRPFAKYKENFDTIRKIGYYIEELAQKNQIPIIQSYNLDAAVSNVLEEIYNQIHRMAGISKSAKAKL
ncbi:MAG: 2-phosphoglycerate kinase [Actinobacteria bacterium]|nr:MAG: 2-phosphoglycerate kinase [Actinomycetota bacterium]